MTRRKRIPKLQPNDIIEVIWKDANTIDGWKSKDEYLRDVAPSRCATSGYYLKHDKDSITIYMTTAKESPIYEKQISTAWTVPLEWVVSVRVIEKATHE